ncbi:dihydroxyacetone kinase phosphoryl donor subunit DhaM [Salisediminibacterium selenitireducens]|uniref:phosphoenolpyruvate--glycerone phosphotransferase n=1 Tax=Bacillus selenitireducens (strain ATCC 700615 / DSM 15326 / MLS10) TaxID=439292 RepID=D6Y070_BACIE|nr:dihydroxyacetone kinase phosphoryl donor subunit DhaM [Salisediminibacterium selenitireducens]ADH98461.1 dihydroxyacetone kinase, phosphotransfer subunit [[Bacillus] selenitireducens MLS10]
MSQPAYGVLLVSHSAKLAEGVMELLKGSAPDVPITWTGGNDDGDLGASFEKIEAALRDNEGEEVMAFYDLGSAKMTLDMVMEMSEKRVHLMDAAMVEGAYTAAALLQGEASFDTITDQLEKLMIKQS